METRKPMSGMGSLLRFAGDSSGATAIEYALVATLIAVAIAAAVFELGGGVKPLYEQLVGKMG